MTNSHNWTPTGELENWASDPPTEKEICTKCSDVCWHYHGVNSYRFRKNERVVSSKETCCGMTKAQFKDKIFTLGRRLELLVKGYTDAEDALSELMELTKILIRDIK